MADYLSPHLDRAALLIIDMQQDFIDGTMPVPGTADILPRLGHLVADFRDAEQPIAHMIRLYPPGGADVDSVRRASIESGAQVVAPGTNGADIPATVLPDGVPVTLNTPRLLDGAAQELSAHEAIFYKPRWSAFYRTTLEPWLRERDVDTVVVTGCNLPNCPRATLFDASERDLRTALVTDAVSQTTPERLTDLELIGTNLLTSTTISAMLRTGRNAPRNS